MKFTKKRYIALTNLNTENITNSLNALTAKWEYIINLVRMSEFIIEKHQDKMPADAVNWLYGNMNLIEEFNLLYEVEQIKEQIANQSNNNKANYNASTGSGLGDEVVFDDNDLPF